MSAVTSPDGKEILKFERADPDNPCNWPTSKKLWVIFLGTLSVLNSTIGSSVPSGDSKQLQEHFNVTVEEQLVLPNSIFLAGYVVGPFLFAPLSENYGRRHVFVGTFALYTIFTMATCLAPNWAAFNVFRLLAGMFGCTPVAITGGLYADLYDNPIHRGRAVSWYLAVASAGPAIGPIPSGYLSVYGWRWPFWFALIFAGACLLPLFFLPETYGPKILSQKAKKIRQNQSGVQVFGPLELQNTGLKNFVFRIIGRPFRMLVSEPIVTASCIYLALIYAVIYMLFQSYELIFQPTYGFNEGEIGLAFLAVVVGSFLALPIAVLWDSYRQSAKRKSRPWAFKEEYQRLPVACLGGPVFAIGMFWMGWTAMKDIHWIVPVLGGLFLGVGFVLIFIALFNYLVDSYKIYSASALGASSISRSAFGVVLPFAARPMYNALGIGWACSLLGFLGLLFALIPFIFIHFGQRLRESSRMCQELNKAPPVAPAPSDEEK